MNYYSQAGQDLFVLGMLNNKRDGYFLEFGAYHSKACSNTFLLESEFGWRGIGFDVQPEYVDEYNENRESICLLGDAQTGFDYKELFLINNVPKQVDYLQLDTDPSDVTLNILKALPLKDYRFSVITFEHDLFRGTDNGNDSQKVKDEQIKILKSFGYQLVVENAKIKGGGEFEDWWVDPTVVDVPKDYKYFPSEMSKIYQVIDWGVPPDPDNIKVF
jgi:hypothetical protein